MGLAANGRQAHNYQAKRNAIIVTHIKMDNPQDIRFGWNSVRNRSGAQAGWGSVAPEIRGSDRGDCRDCDRLRGSRCAEGHRFGRPCPAREISARLAKPDGFRMAADASHLAMAG